MRRVTVLAGLLALAGAQLPSAGAAAHVVGSTGFKYMPTPVEIAAGDTLTYVNNDPLSGEGHSLTHAVAEGTELFKTPIIPAGTSADVAGVADLASGTYQFTCRVHAFMTGTLVVK